MRNFLFGLLTAGLLTAVIVLAAGEFTWSPARDMNAATALTAAPAAQLQPTLQETSLAAPSQDLFAQLYQAISPSVVNIQVTQMSNINSRFSLPAQGQGSGWIWDADGRIVTNNHVVENATEIIVYFNNGRWAEATLIAADPQADLAVIKVTPPAGMALQPLTLAQTVPPVGYTALAFGSPFGLAGSMTEGIISAVGRSFPVSDRTTGVQYSLPDVIQTDAPINPGNSGGPLVDLNGQVIGVNFAIRSEIRANSGVGFAIPVSVVRRVVPALIDEGFFRYAYLGISGGTISPQLAEQVDIPPNTLGVFVSGVVGRPATQAGVREGDIIVAIDDVEVRSFEDLIGYLISETEPGQTVTLHIIRNNSTQTLNLTLGERPRAEVGG